VRVRVTEGPFEGLEGVIEDCTRPDRLILQVEMLGRSVAVELHGAALETLE
jgi:transcription antitermination factor NusG